MINENGAIAILISPQPVVSAYGDIDDQLGYGPQTWLPGITFDPDAMPLNTGGLGPEPDGAGVGSPPQTFAKPWLLSPFPQSGITDTKIQPIFHNTPSVTAANWRCLGLRSVITCITPNMTSQGDVYCWDNRTYYHSEFGSIYDGGDGTGGLSNNAAGMGDVTISLTSGDLNRHMVGPFTTGAQYESLWLPGNDRATDYRGADPRTGWLQVGFVSGAPTSHDAALFTDQAITAGNLLNSPCNLIMLRGVEAGFALRLQVEFAIEVPMTPSCSASLFMWNARLASHFLPEWNALLCMPAGGYPGMGVDCISKCNAGRRGLAQALTGDNAPATVASSAPGIGPAPATRVALSHRPTGGQVATGALDLAMLGGAARHAYNKGWARKAFDLLKRGGNALGRGAQSAARIGGETVAEVGEAGELLPLMIV
jgi:hypothetical protein